MHQDYPFFQPGQTAQRAIRVQLAALLACLDWGFDYPRDEIAPYQLPEKDDGRNVHAFVWIQPSGKLAEDVAEVTASISRSILRREIEPLLLVVDIDDTVDPLNTWLSADGFSHWCEQRTMNPAGSELWERFLDEAYFIQSAALQGAAIELEALEAAHGGANRYVTEKARLAEQDWYRLLSPDVQANVSNYVVSGIQNALRSLGLSDAEGGHLVPRGAEPERPLKQRERTTLLNIIGALLEISATKESAVISSMIEKHPAPGVSKRTLEEKFAAAKRSLRSS